MSIYQVVANFIQPYPGVVVFYFTVLRQDLLIACSNIIESTLHVTLFCLCHVLIVFLQMQTNCLFLIIIVFRYVYTMWYFGLFIFYNKL